MKIASRTSVPCCRKTDSVLSTVLMFTHSGALRGLAVAEGERESVWLAAAEPDGMTARESDEALLSVPELLWVASKSLVVDAAVEADDEALGEGVAVADSEREADLVSDAECELVRVFEDVSEGVGVFERLSEAVFVDERLLELVMVTEEDPDEDKEAVVDVLADCVAVAPSDREKELRSEMLDVIVRVRV